MKRAGAVAAAMALGAAGCVHAGLNRDESQGHPIDVAVTEVPVKGFPVDVVDEGGTHVEGELLASDDAGIYVLTEKNGTAFIARRSVAKVTVAAYPGYPLAAGVVAGLGTVSTLSHGFFLIFTGPAWLITGIGVTVREAMDPKVHVEPGDLASLYQFARFPAGMPAGWRERP
jgi:hypothetical protein